MTTLLIGVGNPDCGDDAAGPLVARRLGGLERHGDALLLALEWQTASRLIIVDAAAPMGQPGRIHRIDPNRRDLPRDWATTSTHAFGLAEALALSRQLGTLPADTTVYAIEGTSFTPGTPPGPAVTAAILRLTARLKRKARGSAPAPRPPAT